MRAGATATAAAAATPLVVTGLFALLPAVPTFALLAAVAGAAAAALVMRTRGRAVAVGVLAGAGVHAAFLACLFAAWEPYEVPF